MLCLEPQLHHWWDLGHLALEPLEGLPNTIASPVHILLEGQDGPRYGPTRVSTRTPRPAPLVRGT